MKMIIAKGKNKQTNKQTNDSPEFEEMAHKLRRWQRRRRRETVRFRKREEGTGHVW
jgi:hypothetical protein